MIKISVAHLATAALTVLLVVPAITAQAGKQAASAPAISKVRIVRLSEVKGEVQIDRAVDRDRLLRTYASRRMVPASLQNQTSICGLRPEEPSPKIEFVFSASPETILRREPRKFALLR